MTSLGALGLIHTPQMVAHLPLTLAYIVINIDPILLRIGAFAIHWYGLMYVVAISVGLWATLRYTARLGIHEDQAWGLFIWAAIAGLIGGRLYFVIQQRDLVSNYLLKPWNIIAVWNGGMAFFGAVFLGSAVLFVLAPRYGLSSFIAIDAGAFFASIGQIFGRFGNIINGDILGQAVSHQLVNIPQNTCAQAPCIAFVSDPTVSPWWSIVYLNPASYASTGVAYHPAPVYEILFNLVMLALLLPVRFKLPRLRAGLFFLMYLALYAVSQFLVFFARGSEPIVDFLGTHILKQAQWTAVVVLLLCIPLYFVIMRVSRPWLFSLDNPVPWEVAQSKSSLDPLAADDGDDNDANNNDPVELPPWQPVRAVGGALRNVFVPPHVSGEH